MRTSLLILSCLTSGFLASPFSTRAEEKLASVFIDYTYAGLTEIAVKDGKLHYVWHTPRQRDDVKAPEQASLANHDRHQVDIWLTEREMGRFRDWIASHKLFEFDKEYRSASDGKARGAAFGSGLTIALGDKKHGISWVGDSKTPKELGAAVNDLAALADAIQKSRSK